MHVHPTIVPGVKKPAPLLVRRELLTNQVADNEIFWKVLNPLELNSPWAQNWKSVVFRGISAEVACVHAAPFDGACAQTRITIRVIGVAVGDGVELLELPPQLSSNVVITNANTGATTKHFFCHIKHPAMPWPLQRCQAERREYDRNSRGTFVAVERGKEIRKIEAAKTGTASTERGGRLSDTRRFTARLAADVIRLPGGVRNRSADDDD